MRRIAFFVEGLTEKLFLIRLVTEIFGGNQVAVEVNKMSGGTKVPITIIQDKKASVDAETKYYILIYDCGGDSTVRSYIDNQRKSLVDKGYEKIIGLRDVFPIPIGNIHLLKKFHNFKTPQKPIPTIFIFSIMEIEAWFLSEYTHFTKIDMTLTLPLIKANLTFDPENDDMQLRPEPTTDLKNCYKLVGKDYAKNEMGLQKTIDALDYSFIYLDIRNKVSSLNELITEIDTLF